MGAAFVCDMTGKTCVGEGLRNVDVDINDKLRLRVTPLLSKGDNRFEQGVVGPAASEKIAEALAVLGKKKGSSKK